MAEARSGDTVRVHYTGRLADGSVFDSSEGRDPIQFTLGQGQVVPGFERAVTGMQPGEERTVTIPAEDAYGPRRDDLVFSVGRDQFPVNVEPEVGQQLQVQQQGGQTGIVRVAEVSDEAVALDANHPLAGQDLIFDLELVEVS